MKDGGETGVSYNLADMHGLEFAAAVLGRPGELNEAAGAGGHDDGSARLLDVFALLLQYLCCNGGIIEVE